MKKAAMAAAALALCLGLLAGCGGTAPAQAPESEVFTAPDLDAAASVASEPESLPAPKPAAEAPAAPARVQVNQEVLALIGQTNAHLKSSSTGEVLSHISSSGHPSVLAYLNDYELPLSLWLNGSDAEIETALAAYQQAGGNREENTYINGNLFADELRVTHILTFNQITHELLFVPGVELTRQSIGEVFGEELEVEHRPGGEGEALEADSWDVFYVHEGYGYMVTYMEGDGGQVPIGTTVWKGDLSGRPAMR